MEVVYGSDLPQVGVSKKSAHMSKMAVVIQMNIQFIADLAVLENSKFKVMFIFSVKSSHVRFTS